MKHAGELLELPRRKRLAKPRPIVVLADVSGSMERYSRLLLQFVYGRRLMDRIAWRASCLPRV